MLFLLTSEVQSGKTRWLEDLVRRLDEQGVVCAGVLAPGVWRELSDGEGADRFEKLGIDNVLLPSGERIPFGRRTDLAQREGCYDSASQSGVAQLGWTIFDEAIGRVNDHFANLAVRAGTCSLCDDVAAAVGSDVSAEALCGSFLVVDEIGRLELQRGGGLVEATSLLKLGPSHAYPHALVVVRSWLADKAEEAFGPVWGTVERIAPSDEGLARVLSAVSA